MFFCYVDEAGCTGMLPHAASPVQPVFVMGGIILNQALLKETTEKFIALKRLFYPNIIQPGSLHLSHILAEVKGAEVRRDALSPSRRKRRHALGFLDHYLRLLEAQQTKVTCRVYVKGVGAPFNGRAVYTSAMQRVCETFQTYLAVARDQGMVVADSRNKPRNAVVSFSIFTQKFKATGDSYDRLLEMPTFGHSENHAGIQLADLLCSALVFPIATATYCLGHVTSVHVQPGYAVLKQRYGPRLKALQYRYQDGAMKWRGGLTVCDVIGKRSSALMFS